jgi:hypothetical protein
MTFPNTFDSPPIHKWNEQDLNDNTIPEKIS